MALQQVDINPNTLNVDSISLGDGTHPFDIAIDPLSEYAYVSDFNTNQIYVVDVNTKSSTYHQHIRTFTVGTSATVPYGLRDLVISNDGKQLFVAATNSNGFRQGSNLSHIFVVDIDPKDLGTTNYETVIKDVIASQKTESLTTTLDPSKILFSSRLNDSEGYGILTIDDPSPTTFKAHTDYLNLNALGTKDSYFAVHNASSIAITPDGQFGFVLGSNTGPFLQGGFRESVDGVQAGSSVGIILNPLNNPQLIAATRPIPDGFSKELAISNDGRYLYVASPVNVGTFVYSITQIEETLLHPENYLIDGLDRGESSRFYNYYPDTLPDGTPVLDGGTPPDPRPAKSEDFRTVPIDDINIAISVAADFGIREENRVKNQFVYGILQSEQNGVLVDSKFGPIGNNASHASMTPGGNWVKLIEPIVKVSDNNNKFNPTFKWSLQRNDGTSVDVDEMSLFVSTANAGDGLYPWDLVDNLNSTPWSVSSYRPTIGDTHSNRILTLTWKRTANSDYGYWYRGDGTQVGLLPERTPTQFTLPTELGLTANQGQVYHWAIEAHSTDGKVRHNDGTFETPPAPVGPIVTTPFVSPSSTGITAASFNGFSGVTIITPDLSPGDNTTVPKSVFDLANGIIKYGGAVLIYDANSGRWVPIDANGNVLNGTISGYDTESITDYQNDLKGFLHIKTGYNDTSSPQLRKSLVLIDNWGDVGTIDNAGWAEDAADRTFASLVQLDQLLGGGVGDPTDATRIYDNKGNLIRTQGAIFNSRLHFIGDGRGTVVDTEIVQRLGTYFPGAGGQVLYSNGVKVDNNRRDLQVTTLDRYTGTIADPAVKTWTNVTYADNYYYQSTGAVSGLTDADWNQQLTGLGSKNAFDWYLGTVNNDKAQALPKTAYVIDGILEGWYYSALAGHNSERNFNTNTFGQKVDLKIDNTAIRRQRGDFAVPTLFDGNFDAIESKNSDTNQLIPGWIGLNQSSLVDWKTIPSLNNAGIIGYGSDGVPLINKFSESYLTNLNITSSSPNNYALELKRNQSITHTAFVIPEWGKLRFNLHVPGIVEDPSVFNQYLKVFIKGTNPGSQEYELDALQVFKQTASSARISERIDGVDVIGGDSPYRAGYQSNQLGYANAGFETFELDIPDEVRGKSQTLRFALGSGSYDVYLDDVAFQSPDLLFGNPTAARVQFDPNLNQADNDSNNSVHQNNYLIEKPQYTIAYSHADNTPLWASWQLNKTWLGSLSREKFESDTRLPADWYKVKKDDYSKGDDPDSPASNLAELEIPGTIDPETNKPFRYAAGHLVPAADRDRNRKDAYEVAQLDNIIPQHEKNNYPVWEGLEEFSRDLAEEKGKELYIIAGRGGSRDVIKAYNASDYINAPDYLWKVIVVLDQPGQGIYDVTSSTKVIAVVSQNTLPPPGSKPYSRWYQGGMQILSVQQLEQMLNNDSINQARGIHYNFFSNLPTDIQANLKNQVFIPGSNPSDQFTLNASLLAGSGTLLGTTTPNTAIWHNGVEENNISIGTSQSLANLGSSQVSTGQVSLVKNGVQMNSTQISGGEISSPEISIIKHSITQIGTSQISRAERSPSQIATSEIGISEIGSIQTTIGQNSTTQVSINEDNSLHIDSIQPSVDQIDTSKVPVKFISSTFDSISSKVTLPSSISFPQFSNTNWTIHDTTPLLTSIYSTAQSIWHTTNDLNLNFEITNLPVGQLAEATITGYDTFGRPNTATISIDDDANGIGWFIDTTPGDSSEFTGTDTYFQATPNSPASGKYDLLTAILHEMGHTLGFINGYSQFNQNIKGRQFYTDSTHSYTLSSDLSHLDNTLYPNDLLNTNLKPGIRKLPSTMDWAIINAISGNSRVGALASSRVVNPAHLTAGALIGITNGDFTTPTTWNTAGATNIINGTATLTEQSQKLAELTQAFIIPTGAKTLQFTIKDNHLIPGDTTKTANDAFEVALLDTNTFNPLAGTSIGLNHTDSLLNIQADGTIHKSDKVTITALGNNSSIVTIDLTQITPSTQATLYFNLLGFGARTSTVTIDDVKLFTDTQPIPITKNDTLVTNQNTPLTLDPTQLTANDTNVTQIQVINQPTHGTLTQTPDGKLTYQPVSTYVGNDSFTYLGFSSDGQISNLATVNLTVNNLPPTIQRIDIPTNIKEGAITTLTATATDIGNDPLTYRWYINGATTAIEGRSIDYTFTDNGNYPVKLEVLDNHGGIATQTVNVTVNNVAPTIGSVTAPNSLTEGSSAQFSATATDPGILDTLTYSWNFSDNTNPVIGQNVNHTFADNGTYNVVLSVTDKDGAVTNQTTSIKVDNVAPTIANITKPTTIKEGETVTFSATAIDPGINDTLTYSWSFGDNTQPAIGENVSHAFADNGTYNVVLTVTDKDGAATTQTLVAKVDNVAPIVVSIVKPNTIKEGELATFSATATDPGILDTLTYSWNFGDNTQPVTGQNVNHTFIDNGTYNLVLTVTDKDGATTTQTVAVKVDNVAPTVVSIAKPTQINEGQAVQFTATATDPGTLDTLTYSWNFGDNTNPVSGRDATHTFADNGNYNVVLTVTDKDGAATTQTVVAKVDNVAPTIVSIVKPTVIKEGESVTFSATATDPGILDTLTYSWNFGDNTNSVTGQNVNHTSADNGNYSVVLTVTDKDGAATTQTVVAKVDNVAPTIVSIAKPTQINEGQAVSFNATVTDPGILDTLTYSWNFGDNTQPTTGQNVTHTFVDNGSYNVALTVTDKDGATTTQTVVAKVDNVAPTVVSIAKPTTIKEGESVTFSATATDPGILDTLTYNWNFGDNTNPIAGQNVNHTFVDNGNYNIVLTVTDKDGAATTQTVVAKVDNVTPTIVSIVKPTTIKEGESVLFKATATDPGILDTLTYSWNFGDTTPAVTGQNINHTFADNGNYNVVLTVTDKDVTDKDGAVTTQTVVTKVDNVAPTIVSIDKPTIIKEGESVLFKANAIDAGINDTLTYSWNFGDSTPVAIGQNVNHTFADNGNYNVVLTVTDKDGGVTTQTVIAKVDNVAPTIVSIVKPNTIKEGESVTFAATATDPGILDTLTYSWNFGDNTSPVSGQNATHTFADNGNYNVILTVTDKDGGITTQTVVAKVDNVAPTIVSIAKPTQINEGQAVSFSATVTDPGILDTLTYSWNFGDTTPAVNGQTATHTFADNGNYNVVLTVTDKDGAATTQTVVAKVDNVAPTIVSITKPNQINEGQAATFTATATDPGIKDTLTYSWNFGDNTSAITGASATHTFADNGNYNVILTVTDKDGGVTTQTTAVKVDNVAPVIVSISKPTKIDEGQAITFAATATDVGIKDTLTYSWNFGDSTTQASGQTTTHTFADNGNYNVILTVTDKDGGVTTQNVTVKVDNVAPTIVSITKPTTINQGQAATFAATATDPGTLDTLNYSWNFGDNTQPTTGQNAAHTFTTAGNFTLTLTVTDKDGAATTTTQQITVAPLPTITINDPTITEGDSGTTNLTFTLTLSQASTQAVSVAYNTSNITALSGSDYTATSGAITFNAGETTKTITVAILGDTIAESTETFALNLTNAINATISKTQGTATILDNDPVAITSGIRSGGTVTISGSANLDGNVNSRTDDTKIYAAVGVNLTGSITLPVKRDAAGNPLKDANGKFILETNEITVAPGGSTSSLSSKYSGIASATQTITIPTYTDTKQQDFLAKVPATGVITYDIGLNPIGNIATWNTKFPPAGTATNPTVVRIINGSLNLPANINLSNYILECCDLVREK